MSASLVGSEMCIRDSYNAYNHHHTTTPHTTTHTTTLATTTTPLYYNAYICLLYTSDAADDM
eukprot:10121923-Alexandrium_andersonii.AAC.1